MNASPAETRAPAAPAPPADEADAPEVSARPPPGRGWRAYALTAGMVAVATGVGTLGRGHLALPELVMMYLLVVVIAAARFGRGPALVAAASTILAFDFFFIPPYYAFSVSEQRHVLTFAIMFAVGLLTSGLTLRIRRQELEARHREERIASLYKLSRELSSAASAEEAARATTRHAAAIFQGAAAVSLLEGDKALPPLASSGGALPQGAAAAAVISVPLRSAADTIGVLTVAPGAPLGPEQRHLLDAFARQAALALARARLAQEAAAAAVRATTEEMRSSLLSAVSHDLRTPLGAITGAATTLRDGGAAIDGAERAELLDTICEEADRLERLVRNLLDMTRLESGALEVRREWIPLEEIVGSALGRLDARLAGRPLRTDLPADLPLLSGDAVLLEQVLVNLLENAAKYTPAGSAIDVSARADAGTMIIEVADRGPGLPPGSEGRLFEKFFRGRHGGVQGSGLGLAICRGIVEAHGGTLSAHARPGGGALFRVSLPLPDGPPSPPPDLEAEREPAPA